MGWRDIVGLCGLCAVVGDCSFVVFGCFVGFDFGFLWLGMGFLVV